MGKRGPSENSLRLSELGAAYAIGYIASGRTEYDRGYIESYKQIFDDIVNGRNPKYDAAATRRIQRDKRKLRLRDEKLSSFFNLSEKEKYYLFEVNNLSEEGRKKLLSLIIDTYPDISFFEDPAPDKKNKYNYSHDMALKPINEQIDYICNLYFKALIKVKRLLKVMTPGDGFFFVNPSELLNAYGEDVCREELRNVLASYIGDVTCSNLVVDNNYIKSLAKKSACYELEISYKFPNVRISNEKDKITENTCFRNKAISLRGKNKEISFNLKLPGYSLCRKEIREAEKHKTPDTIYEDKFDYELYPMTAMMGPHKGLKIKEDNYNMFKDSWLSVIKKLDFAGKSNLDDNDIIIFVDYPITIGEKEYDRISFILKGNLIANAKLAKEWINNRFFEEIK